MKILVNVYYSSTSEDLPLVKSYETSLSDSASYAEKMEVVMDQVFKDPDLLGKDNLTFEIIS